MEKEKKSQVKKKPKQNMNYNDQTMKLALQQISEGMSVSSASKAFGIPRTTLQDKKFGRHQRSVGAPTILTQDEGKVFINWIVELGKQGFPVTKDQLLYSVYKYMAENG